MENIVTTGSCLCGKITYQIDKFSPVIGHCHCTMCQKFHGAAFSTFAEVNTTDFHWLSGEELLASYQADNGTIRQFCRCCGSSLTYSSSFNRQDSSIEIAVATLDNAPELTPTAHIFIDTKAHWFSFDDPLPKYQGYRNNDTDD